MITGGSWGGYLTLLALGTQPRAWAAGVAAVPVADYVAAYEDEMEGLKAIDRVFFGGSPDGGARGLRAEQPDDLPRRRPGAGARASPGRTTRAARSGRSRTTWPAWPSAGKAHEVYRFDAGHGSLVVEERVRQARAELDFVRVRVPA